MLQSKKEDPENLHEKDDGPYIAPLVENVGKTLIEWAEKYWGIKTAYKLLDEAKGSNEESTPWSYVRNIFINEINELVDRKTS